MTESNNHGGNVYAYSALKGIAPMDIIDYSANINPLGPHEGGLLAISTHLEEICHYPDPHSTRLRSVVSHTYNIPRENILLGNGAAEIIYGASRLSHIQKVIVTKPTFGGYREGALSASLPIITVEKPIGESLPIDSLLEVDTENALICIGSPNNPDGSIESKNSIGEYLKKLPQTAYLMVDESFIDFTKQGSCRQLIHEFPNLIVLHSFTKFYAIPGLRLGAAYMDVSLREQLEQFIPTWSVNRVAQIYGEIAIEDKAYREESAIFMNKECQRVYDKYRLMSSISPLKPTVNFMLLHHQGGERQVHDLIEKLNAKNILVRHCKNVEGLGPDWIRIAIKTKQLNDYLYDTIKSIVEGEDNERDLFSSAR